MDREIDAGTRRRRVAGRVATGFAGLVAVSLLLALLPGWFRPSLRRERIRTGRVERGRVEATVEASGIVLPAFEKVLSSPVETRVLRILRRPGDKVAPGDPVVELDTSATRLELDRLEERLAQKRNEQEQVRLELEKTLADLRARADAAGLDVEILDYRVKQRRQLREQGLVSEEALREIEVEARKASIQLDQLDEAVANEQRASEARLRGLTLDLTILEKEAGEARRQLQLATATADRAGVLTWTVEQEGATVRKGEVLARIADLESFRVEGSVSDVHASRLRSGETVRVRLDERELEGRLSSIDPTIENGVLKFEVALDDPGDPALRNNQRVDVHVVTDVRDDVLKMPKFSYARGGAVQDVFFVRGDRAYRQSVRVGLSGYEGLEVLDGAREGDEIIVSDMQDYLHLGEIEIQ